MRGARETLLKIYWTKGSLEGVEVEILTRGAPNDVSIVSGEEISRIGRHYLELRGTKIPYHRVLKIRYRGEIVFQRRSS